MQVDIWGRILGRDIVRMFTFIGEFRARLGANSGSNVYSFSCFLTVYVLIYCIFVHLLSNQEHTFTVVTS